MNDCTNVEKDRVLEQQLLHEIETLEAQIQLVERARDSDIVSRASNHIRTTGGVSEKEEINIRADANARVQTQLDDLCARQDILKARLAQLQTLSSRQT